MSGAEALARVLCASDDEDPDKAVRGLTGDRPAWTYNREQAERILADPGPLLAALAEAGVLEVEHVDRCKSCGELVTETPELPSER